MINQNNFGHVFLKSQDYHLIYCYSKHVSYIFQALFLVEHHRKGLFELHKHFTQNTKLNQPLLETHQ